MKRARVVPPQRTILFCIGIGPLAWSERPRGPRSVKPRAETMACREFGAGTALRDQGDEARLRASRPPRSPGLRRETVLPRHHSAAPVRDCRTLDFYVKLAAEGAAIDLLSSTAQQVLSAIGVAKHLSSATAHRIRAPVRIM